MVKRLLIVSLIVLTACALLTSGAIYRGRETLDGVLAFHSNRDGYLEIYLTDIGTGITQNLTNNTASDYFPDFSPEGREVVFFSNRGGYATNLYSLDLESGEVHRLSELNSVAANVAPKWSPNGELIAFIGQDEAVMGSYGMYILCVQDGTTTFIVDDVGPFSIPYWSPDGSKLTFVSSFGAGYSIYVADIVTGEFRNLNSNPEEKNVDPSLSWSLDGTELAFAVGGEIYVFNLETDQLHSVSHPAGLVAYDMTPAWSPNRQWMAFASIRGGSDVAGIYFFDSDWAVQMLYHSIETSYRPIWSPSGRWIAFTSNIPNNPSRDIYLVETYTGSVRNITSNPSDDYAPVWLPG